MQLRLAHLKHAGKAWRLPDYDPRSLATGIVHLGLGNFPRAHLAAYTDVVLGRDTSWGICGVSLKSRGVTGALAGQDHLYTLLVRCAGNVAPRVIASVHSSLSGADGIAPVLGRIAAPATRIVSLTVTEKGYCHDPAGGALDLAHADIVHDLAYPATPMSAPGVLLRIAPGRSRWMARKNCLSACWAPRVSAFRTAMASTPSHWPSRAGCAT